MVLFDKKMNRILSPLKSLIKNRFFWFIAGLALVPLIRYSEKQIRRTPTAIDAMGWVSHYEERKLQFTVLPDFSYSLHFPGDREKFEMFVKRMGLQHHKVSEDEYKEVSGEGERSVRFSPDHKGFEIEFSSNQT